MNREQLKLLSQEELIEIILSLQVEIEQLRARVQELEELIFRPRKTPENSHLPPSLGRKGDIKPKAEGKKPGAKLGHEGKSRKRSEPDFIIECKVEHCNGCGANLSKLAQREMGRSQVIELPPVKPIIVEAIRYEVCCPWCGKQQMAEYPEGIETYQVFGNRLLSLVAYLHHIHHVGYFRLKEVLRDIFGLEISVGALVNAVTRSGRLLEDRTEAILEVLRNSRVIGSDETGARVKGRNWWEWVFNTKDVSYHVIAPSRSSGVIEEVMGETEVDVWLSDLYSAQQKARSKQKQICLAHQIRDLKYVMEAERSLFAFKMLRLFKRAIGLKKARERITEYCYWHQVEEIEAGCDKLLKERYRGKESERLRKRYVKHRDKLFVGLYREDVPLVNNDCERSLRNSVIHRKVSYGFRSEFGAKVYERVATVIGTARRQGQEVLTTLQGLMGTPVPALSRSPP
jgi:transposase